MADPKKDQEAIDRIIENVKAESERQSNEWVGDAKGMVE
jgi:hypothetical protein